MRARSTLPAGLVGLVAFVAVGAVVAVGALPASTAHAQAPPFAPLSPRSEQVAAILGLEPLIARLAAVGPGATLEARVERLELEAEALAELQRLSLLIDGTLALLQQEQFASASAQSFVDARRENSVATWNIAALLVGNALTVVGTSLQFDGNQQAYIGDGLIIGGAVLATAFSVVALVHKDHGRVPFAIETNFLARPLGRAPTAASELPEPIWRYLDTPLAGQESLRSQLLAKWRQDASISTSLSPSARRMVDLLTRPIAQHEVISADLLGTRAEMLADLRARVAALNLEVQELVRLVRARH